MPLLLFLTELSWRHRVSGVVCFGRLAANTACCVCACSCLRLPIHSARAWVRRVRGGSGAESEPRVFYLHLNEAWELIYPSAAFKPAPSLSSGLPASQTDIDLFARQGDPECCFSSLLSLSFVSGKGLDPAHCCRAAALRTWTSLPPCQFMCVCWLVWVCKNTHRACVCLGLCECAGVPVSDWSDVFIKHRCCVDL